MRISLTRGRTLAAVGTLAVALSASAMAPALASNGSAGTLSFAVFGDSPYGTKPGDDRQVRDTPAFIQNINADSDVSDVLMVGDIHSGKTYCTQAYDESIASLWSAFAQSIVYTPGDNEWTDCHKAGEGGHVYDAAGNPVDYADGDPLDNLALVRSLFFSDPSKPLGNGNLVVQSQADQYDPAHPEDAAFVENAMFVRKGVQFVTLDVPGGSNNDADPWYGAPVTARQTAEREARTAADLRWLDAAFARATADGAPAVVVMIQADMWDLDGKSPAAHHLTNYEPLVQSLAAHTNAFGRPVLLLNGDSHTYRSDNPFDATAPCTTESGAAIVACPTDPADQRSAVAETATHPGYTVPGFHRIVVHGSSYPLEWLKLTFDPRGNASGDNAFGPFSWSRQATGLNGS